MRITSSTATGITLTWHSNVHQAQEGYGANMIVVQLSTWRSDVVEHGLLDSKGRMIGNYACIKHGHTHLADLYKVTTQATRDGKTFGAISTKGTMCLTLDEAKAVAVKKIAAAGKRFARAVAKGEGKQFAAKAVAS